MSKKSDFQAFLRAKDAYENAQKLYRRGSLNKDELVEIAQEYHSAQDKVCTYDR